VGPILRAAAAVAFLAVIAAGSGVLADQVTRFAVVSGNNLGLARTDPLKYAERDARRMARLLREIGGVREENLVLLEGPDPDERRRAFDEISAQAEREGGDAVFLFYYSGHADSGMLRMGGRGISLGEIRRRLEQMPAKVRVAIVDACQSGKITHEKGGRVVLPFLEENPVSVEGLVILTSASAAEPAQESEDLQSSFFSHYLMSGLRGPADATGDGRISAIEAYEYAYRYTVMETEGSTAGAQHPTFLYALKGEGDISLTEIREGQARVELAAEMDGTVLFYGDSGGIEAEVVKRRGGRVSVALHPGDYRLRWRSDKALWKASVTLSNGQSREVLATDFEQIPIARVVSKGVADEPEAAGDDGAAKPDAGPAPLTEVPLGGGSSWSSGARPRTAPAAAPEVPSKAAGVHIGGDTEPEGPVYDGSSSFAKRPGARLPPGASAATSLLLPGFGHGADRQFARAGTITGIFLTSIVGAGLLLDNVRRSDTDPVRGLKLAGGGALAMTAFYTYAFAAIDAFYSTSRGGPGSPDLDELLPDLSTAVAPVLLRTPDGVDGGVGGGLGIGFAVHRNLVLGVREVCFIPGLGDQVATIGFAPELKVRGWPPAS